MKFAGKTVKDFSGPELARLVQENPKADTTEIFSVAGEYGNVPHGHLDVRRGGAMPDLDEVGVMAYEDLLLAALRCVGTDYQDYARFAGVEVDSVRLSIEGRWDWRSHLRVYGAPAPADVAPTWNRLTVRAVVRTNASRAQAEKAHRFAWDNNVAAAGLAAIPVTHEVTVEAPARGAARTVRARA